MVGPKDQSGVAGRNVGITKMPNRDTGKHIYNTDFLYSKACVRNGIS